ncbi:hypothetical protein SVEN_2498 [Streptomyces venezuelae ATCC 10712]|uniref:Uncharacterized protein n=1 Tax=Streptomyces venezuelae (strain ATCC 10712 / CBS 650.69 / DSM 40230 / JCM 4526 / NBRC 13096 / PD 04745) TaxID=953739 RepID=F2R3E2_STRVP|nr:hypothetical protein SVEN_2498 [Streptomyces venezuelae ATCC 10712]
MPARQLAKVKQTIPVSAGTAGTSPSTASPMTGVADTKEHQPTPPLIGATGDE